MSDITWWPSKNEYDPNISKEKWLNAPPFDMDAFKNALAAYKNNFNLHIDDEIYKWEAVKQFQDYWDVDAENFSEMLDKAFAKTFNLLANVNNFPLAMLKELCVISTGDIRSAFKNLYDETLPVTERIQNFINVTDKINSNYKPDKSTYQRTNAISTYLWLRYPEKYVIYKYSEIDSVSRVLNALYEPKSGSIETVEDGFNFYDQLSKELRKDSELVGMIKSKLTDDCYSDPEFKTLTIDFGFFISRYYHKNWIVPCNPNDYDVDGAFKKNKVLNWKQSKNYSVGDYVYIYITNPQKRISYKTVVTKTDVSAEELINDGEFEINNENYKDSKKMEIRLIGTSTDDGLIYSELKNHGLKSNLQSAEIVKPDMFEYIDSFFSEKNKLKLGDKCMENFEKYKELLIENKNIILHGAPGTGKTYLAKKIAEAMGCSKEEIGFCQFHPSYDYTDFVEGLRPAKNNGFERRNGTFKEFCKKALQNLIDSKKTVIQIQTELSWQEKIKIFLDDAIENRIECALKKKGCVVIENYHEDIVDISLPDNDSHKEDTIHISKLLKILSTEKSFESAIEIEQFLEGFHSAEYSYILAVYKKIKDYSFDSNTNVKTVSEVKPKNFVFIIDEINRGELSKIFGELFFSIDPGYRGLDENGKPRGLVQTQYQNLIDKDDVFSEGFYIPDNVYIIGTMNDIDRSVESMDFAMRRRFIFEEVTADESAENMQLPQDVKDRMKRINNQISKTEGLNSAYHIGGAYFRNVTDFEKLWNLKLSSLVKEYLRGMDDDDSKYKKIENAYFDKSEITSETETEIKASIEN